MVERVQLGSVSLLFGDLAYIARLTHHSSLVSLELGRPTMIDDDDCDAGEPTPVNDDCIQPHGITQPPQGTTPPNGLIVVIPVVRIFAQLKKTTKARTITPATLSTYDDHFKSIMASYPDPFPIFSQAHLDPRLLSAACTLQSARIFLYRHNLSPACRREDRIHALDRCVQAATDTAHYIERSMQQPSPSHNSGFYSPVHMANWGARLRTMAPAFLCSHLWRCALVLCLRLQFAPALTIVQASTSIGDLRKNNISCGRNLAFFLEKLVGRLRSGANQQKLENDEEMLAYASGDLQACADESWVWSGAGTAYANNPNSNGATPDRATAGPPTPSSLSERELHEWGGWENVQRVLTQLFNEHQQRTPSSAPAPTPPMQPQQHSQQQQQQQQHSSYPPTPSQYPLPQQPSTNTPPTQYPNPPQQGASHPPPPPASLQPQTSLSPVGSNGAAASSRISIKDIM